jgi:hypothetical protein
MKEIAVRYAPQRSELIEATDTVVVNVEEKKGR